VCTSHRPTRLPLQDQRIFYRNITGFYRTKHMEYTRVTQILQKSRNHHKILSARGVTRNQFQTEELYLYSPFWVFEDCSRANFTFTFNFNLHHTKLSCQGDLAPVICAPMECTNCVCVCVCTKCTLCSIKSRGTNSNHINLQRLMRWKLKPNRRDRAATSLPQV
jgi:hypothetical protein